MMAGRPHQAESQFATARRFHRGESGARGGARMLWNVRQIRSVAIEIDGLFEPGQMLDGMCLQQRSLLGHSGFGPGDRNLLLAAKPLESHLNSFGPFGMSG